MDNGKAGFVGSGIEKRYHTSAFVVVIACIAAIGGILFGFDTGIISGAILFIAPLFKLTALQNGFVVGAVSFGACIGALISGRFSDHFGRRRLLVFAALLFIISTIITALAGNLGVLLAGRVLVGFAIGISSFTAPLYISEVSPPQFRGLLVSLNQLAVTVGILLSYFIDYAFAPDGGWRWMLGAGVVPAVILLIGMIVLPESPRWLILKGLHDQARGVLQKIRSAADVSVEFQEIETSLLKLGKGDWRLLFASWVRPAIIIVFGLAIAQQFTGINTIIYYAPTIFRLAGVSSDAAAIGRTIGVGVVNVVFTIVALYLLDKVGRKPLLYVGIGGMLISLVVLGVAFSLHSTGSDVLMGTLTLAALLLFIACFAFSLGPIMWLIFAEVFPLKIRGFGTAIAGSFNWLCTLIVSGTFLPLVKTIGESATFFLYACIALLSLVFVFWLVPETKGVTLETIETNLHNGVRSRDLGS